jgi:hypothetical protein
VYLHILVQRFTVQVLILESDTNSEENPQRERLQA